MCSFLFENAILFSFPVLVNWSAFQFIISHSRFRVQAENMIGRGTFSGYKCGTTLPPPPAPPHLSLASCSANMLKVVWGKKSNRNMTFVLQLASPGNQ